METLRVRGQEVQLRLIKNRELMRTLTAIKSFTFTAKFNRSTESFLGETAPRNDDIFMGVEMQIEWQPEAKDSLELIVFARDRASRRSFQQQNVSVVTASFVVAFPNGDRPRITTPDLKFGDMTLPVAGRETFVSQTISAGCDDFKYAPQ